MNTLTRRIRWRVACLRVVLLMCWLTLRASEQLAPSSTVLADDLMSMSLEQLMDIQVEIATRTPQKIKEVPAAVTVITGDDIRRSGATSIAEALRLSPGVEAAQINNNSWAVGIRGFNGYLNNSLLVLVDGKSHYAPLFAGTYWDAVDTVLDDIERIEIIRGPGSSVWGANSMNGVVNVITKSAKDTQGALVKAGYGTELQGLVAGRYGAQLGENVFLRLFGKHSNTQNSQFRGGGKAYDGFASNRGGFRLDWEPQETTQVTFQGDVFSMHEHNVFNLVPAGGAMRTPVFDDMYNKGGNFLGRLTKELESGITLNFQGYYDRSDRRSILVNDLESIGDLDFSVSGPKGEQHEWSGGLGYRVTHDHVDATQNNSAQILIPSRTMSVYSAYVQDTIELKPDKWNLTLGSKFEHNDYSGFEVQPGLRLQYAVHPKHTLWGSVTRAVRTPSRSESDIRITAGTPFFPITFDGNPQLEAEDLLAYELGYKGSMTDKLALDVAMFYNDYSDLVGTDLVSMARGIHGRFGNSFSAEFYGLELAPRYQVFDWWRLVAAYTIQYNHFKKPATSPEALPSEAPRHLLNLRSQMDLTENIQFDVIGRYVGKTNFSNASAGTSVDVPGYFGLDARLAWKPTTNLELAIIGKNLLTPSHPEFVETSLAFTSTEIQRSVFATLTWQF